MEFLKSYGEYHLIKSLKVKNINKLVYFLMKKTIVKSKSKDIVLYKG